jgi:hypothetical protein
VGYAVGVAHGVKLPGDELAFSHVHLPARHGLSDPADDHGRVRTCGRSGYIRTELVPVRTAATFDDRAELTPKQLCILDGAERIMERVSRGIHYHRADLGALRREV